VSPTNERAEEKTEKRNIHRKAFTFHTLHTRTVRVRFIPSHPPKKLQDLDNA